MSLEIRVIPTAGPDDVSGMPTLPDGSRVVAVLGKTEGNGCVNDFSRGFASRAWRDAVGSDVVTIMSGGTEGVLSPHVSLLIDDPAERPGVAGGSLGVGAAVTDAIPPSELGRRGQAEMVAASVTEACDRGGFAPSDAALVVVKCPLLTLAQIETLMADGKSAVTDDSYASMGASRGASALGVGLAIGEIDEDGVVRGLAGDLGVYSARASTSAGVELAVCEVVAIGPSASASGGLRARTVVMRDACDAEVVLELLDHIRERSGRIVQVFAKCEPDPRGQIRGRRHTMLSDSDLNATRHARAAVGGLLAGLTGHPDIYVSGGAEHQGPPGGGTLTIVWDE
jgi:cyanuric acid amidohydrolase